MFIVYLCVSLPKWQVNTNSCVTVDEKWKNNNTDNNQQKQPKYNNI